MKWRRFLAAGASWLALSASCAASEPPDSPAFAPNEGEVLAVDRNEGEITIRHGRLLELDMPPMAMVFKVADPSFLHKVRKGDRVRFKAGLVDGRFGVTAIEPLRPHLRQ